MTQILSSAPRSGTLPYGEVVYVDDGTDPLGTVEQITGGSNSMGIPRAEVTTYDPRLTSGAARGATKPDAGTFGASVKSFVRNLAEIINPSNPVASADHYIAGHEAKFQAAISSLGNDHTIQSLATYAANNGLEPAQVLSRAISNGIGAGVLSDAANVAAGAGLSSGTGVIGVEAAAVALTLGAVSHDYDAITGNTTVGKVEHQLTQLFTAYAHGSIAHSTF